MRSTRLPRRRAGIVACAVALFACAAAHAACTSVMPNSTTAYVSCSSASDSLTIWEAFGSWVHSATFGANQFDWDTGAVGEQDLPPGSTINVSFAGAGGTLVIGTAAVPADTLNGTVTLTSGGTSATVHVTIDASGSTTGRTYTIDDLAGYNSVGSLQFKDGSASGLTLSVVAGAGADAFDVLSVAPADVIFIQGTDGADTVSFGGGINTLQNIKGAVDVGNNGGTTELIFDDSADVVGRSVTLGGDDQTESLAGAAPGQVSWATSDVGLITYYMGSGSDDLAVQHLVNPRGLTQLYVDGENGADVVTIGGGANGAQSVIAPIGVVNTIGSTTLLVDDGNDVTPRNATVHVAGSLGYLVGAAPATITWYIGQTAEVDLTMGQAADSVVVESTQTPLRIDGSTGADSVTLGFSGSVQGIAAPVDVRNIGDYSTLTIDDSSDATGRSITVSADGTESKVVGIAPAAISWRDPDFSAVTIKPGTGNDAVTVGSLDDNPDHAFQFAIHTAGGSDSVTFGAGGSVQAVHAAVSVANDAFYTAVMINDQLDPVPRGVAIGATSVTRLTPKPLTWNAADVDSVLVLLGTGGNIAHLNGSNGFTPTTTTLNLGPGSNLCYINGAGLGTDSVNNVVGGGTDDLFIVSAVPIGVASLTIYGGGQVAGDEIIYTGGAATGAFPGNGTLTPTTFGAIPINYYSIEKFSIDDTLFRDGFE